MTTVRSTNASVSVASSSSAAAAGGSVIDVNSLVSQLVAATRAPKDSLISNQTQQVTTQISAIGTLKGALSDFQTSLEPLATAGSFNASAANTSNDSVFTATADANAVGGSYNVSVAQLAQAQQLVSGAFNGVGAGVIGTGTLQLSLGANSFSVNIGSTNNSVAGIASAINSAAGNPGITATVLNGTDGAHLVLSSTQSGAANTIKVAETDGGAGLNPFLFDTTNTSHYTQVTAAQDAAFSISGIPYTSASNTVTSALGGVTLNLKAVTLAGTGPGSSATLTVAPDTDTIEKNVSAFVDAYNTMVGSISKLNSFDPTTKTAGPMLGDAVLSGIQNQMRSTLYSIVNTGSSTYNSLASVGITTKSDGTLNFDKSRFETALATAPAAVSSLFAGTSGIAASLNSQITSDLNSGGVIDSRSQTLVKQENALTQQTTALDKQMTSLTATLTQQYASLNTLLSSLQSTSAYLSQQFAALPQVQQKN